jgi:hypothetical protein
MAAISAQQAGHRADAGLTASLNEPHWVLGAFFIVLFSDRRFNTAVLGGLLDALQLILAMALAGVASAIPGFIELFTNFVIPRGRS